MMMREQSVVGYLLWRRAEGTLGPNENFVGRGNQPPPEFYHEEASQSLLFKLLYMMAALAVMFTALYPLLNQSKRTPEDIDL